MSVESTPPTTTTGPPSLTPAVEQLHLGLQRVVACIDRCFARRELGEGDPEAPDEEAVARFLACDRQVEAIDAYLAAQYGDPSLPLSQLVARFKLSTRATQILLAAAAPALDVTVARRLHALAGRPQPDAGLLVEMLARDALVEDAYVAELAPSAPLVRWRLVRLGVSRLWSPETPLLHRPVVVPERVIEWLRGETVFAGERYDGIAKLHAPSDKIAAVVPVEERDRVARALARERDGRPLPLVLTGPALSGKATTTLAAASSLGMPALEVDLEAVVAVREPEWLLDELVREAAMHRAVLLLRHGDAVPPKRADLKRALLGVLCGGTVHVVLTTQGDWSDVVRKIPGAHAIRCDLPSENEQAALWARALPPSVTRAPDVHVEDITARYRLTPGDILEAGAAAIAAAGVRGPDQPVTFRDVVDAVRGRLRHRLGDIAELVTTELGWDDLVLRPDVLDRIIELLSSVRYDRRVMSDWGFAKKMAYGRAASALFAGPPGTGKTMVATLIARELGKELFRVDLSRVVSKWVGETEKNLGRAFDEARTAQAILLFDEADSLFARRTDVKSANDRYANLEVNYLLQRLEAFDGIVLLTTNKDSSIDEAFSRRLRFRIHFPAPEATEREQLWRSMLPSTAPVDRGVDFAALASRFEMSGGYIKNAVMRAAYLAAASDGQRITNDLLVRAAQLEWEEMGRLTR